MISAPATVSPVHRTLAADLPRRIGRQVTVQGWLHRRRTLKSLAFLILRDRSGLAQAVVTGPEAATVVGGHPEETVLQITGTVTANPQAPGGAELIRPAVTALSGPATAPPFDLYRPTVAATLPTILDHAPVALRHPLLGAPHLTSSGRSGRVTARTGRPPAYGR